MFVERYTVVPAVDVEALRAALRSVAAGADVTVALGPSLLGTLDMDALPSGMHPFVDPDRRVRPLRDDVVLLADDDGHDRSDQLAATATLVEREQVGLDPWPPGRPGVLVLGRSAAGGDVLLVGGTAPDTAAADLLLPGVLATLVGSSEEGGRTLGADLYVVPDQDGLDAVLAPRDG